MPFKHKSGCRKRHERKEQDERVAKLAKLSSFGFVAKSVQEDATSDPQPNSNECETQPPG